MRLNELTSRCMNIRFQKIKLRKQGVITIHVIKFFVAFLLDAFNDLSLSVNYTINKKYML